MRLAVTCLTIISALWLLSSGTQDKTDIHPNHFPYYKMITPDSLKSDIGRYALETDIYAYTNSRFSNLRVFDSNRQEAPYLIQIEQETRTDTVQVRLQHEIINFEEHPDNRIEILLRLHDPLLPTTQLAIATAQKNYEKQVTVWGSSDRNSWQELVKSQPIFDYSRFIDVQNNKIDLPGQTFRYYKLTIDNIRESQNSPLSGIILETRDDAIFQQKEVRTLRWSTLRIDKLILSGEKTQTTQKQPVIVTYPVECCRIEEDIDTNQSYVYVESNRLPLTRLTLETATPNFSRPVELTGTDSLSEESVWKPIMTAQITRIEVNNYQKEELTLQFPVQRFRHYRLAIHNHDNIPLEITGIQAEGVSYQLLFLPQPDQNYRLFYGGSDIRPPQYDIQTVLNAVDIASATTFQGGRTITNSSYQLRNPQKWLLNPQTLLVIAILVMIFVLGAVILKVSQKVEAI